MVCICIETVCSLWFVKISSFCKKKIKINKKKKNEWVLRLDKPRQWRTWDFHLRCADPNTQLSFGSKPRIFMWVWEWAQDFYVNFQSRARVFIMVLKADQGATTPTWLYLGPPLNPAKGGTRLSHHHGVNDRTHNTTFIFTYSSLRTPIVTQHPDCLHQPILPAHTNHPNKYMAGTKK